MSLKNQRLLISAIRFGILGAKTPFISKRIGAPAILRGDVLRLPPDQNLGGQGLITGISAAVAQ